jgi:uncharacterized phage protein gp47/JayE
MEIKTFQQIYESIRNYMVSHQDKITDFNDGSVNASFNEAVAREISDLYVRARVGFYSYLRGLPYSIFRFEQKLGQKASTVLVFSRSRPMPYDSSIPEGTTVSANGLKFLTSSANSILSGQTDSAEIPALALEVGDKYNIPLGAVNKIESSLMADIVAVTNATPATGGVNKEAWGDYVSRFNEYILGLQRTNGYGFISGITGAYVIRSMKIVEHFPPLDNIWNVTVYLEDGSGTISQNGIDWVKAKIDGKGTKDDGGFRAPGINIRYLPPEQFPVMITVTATTIHDVANEIDVSMVESDVTDSIKTFIDNLKIAEELIISDLTVVLRRIEYLDDVKITLPVENIKPVNNQILRFAGCNVTVVVG